MRSIYEIIRVKHRQLVGNLGIRNPKRRVRESIERAIEDTLL